MEEESTEKFLAGLTLTGTAGLLGLYPRPVVAEPPPETTTLKLARVQGSICRVPQALAEELLRSEGFTDVHYIVQEGSSGTTKALASGEVDISMQYIGPSIIQVDRGDPIVLLAGVQVGCFELFGTDRVRSIRDLKGKAVSKVSAGSAGDVGSSDYIFLASMMAYVGLDPRKDIRWVTHPTAEAMQLLAEGTIDGFLGLPPESQQLRARKIGHVVVSSMVDRPWSQYFCCLVTGNREFVREHPVATKRALRAILKAADVCASDPERVARFLVEKGATERYDYALQALQEIPYNQWREYDHEDTVRFYALRLHEVGMIKSGPQKIIAQGTDWRFLNELKREMKG